MENLQELRLSALERARDFITRHTDRLSDIARSGAFARLEEILASIAEHAHGQWQRTAVGQVATVAKKELRRLLLRRHMRPIARVARLAEGRKPELKLIQLPTRRLSNMRFVEAAHGMAHSASLNPEPFVAAGLPADFVQQLHDAADRLERADDAKRWVGFERAMDTHSIRVRLAEGHKVLGVLDAMVKDVLHGERFLLEEWTAVTRVGVPALGPGTAMRRLLSGEKEGRALPAGDGEGQRLLEPPGGGRRTLKRLLGLGSAEDR